MALIKCPECNKEFSDQAPCCPNCGFPTENILKATKEEKSKNKNLIFKKVLLIFVAILGIAAMVFIVRFSKNKPDKSGYYNGLAWGITYDEIKNKYPDIVEANTNDGKEAYKTTISDVLNMKGVAADVAFAFNDDKLYQLFFLISDENIPTNNSLDDVLKTICQKFDDSYGKGTENKVIDGVEAYEWKTEKSDITVLKLSGYIAMVYEDIELSDK